MNTDADGLGNGSAATDDRYHGPLGLSGGLGGGLSGPGLGGNGTMGAAGMAGGGLSSAGLGMGALPAGPIGTGPIGNSPMGPGPLAPFRGGQRRDGLADGEVRRNGAGVDAGGPSLASVLDTGSLKEPVLSGEDWLEPAPHPGAGLADHPLLRGLLMELPPKGTMPTGEWLDRWFEAARSILELLYAQHAR